MTRRFLMPGIVAALALGQAASASSEDLKIPVPATDVQQLIVDYQCEKMAPMKVVYINAGPNGLAIVPVNGESLIFASVISGSGARYAAGPYIWWSHQGGATLDDVRNDEDVAPVKCKRVK